MDQMVNWLNQQTVNLSPPAMNVRFIPGPPIQLVPIYWYKLNKMKPCFVHRYNNPFFWVVQK